MSDVSLTECGCCGTPTPAPDRGNPPGRPAVAYRLSTHAGFKRALLDAVSRDRRLDRLTTRADDDPVIALLDGWAAVLDVLAFHAERIANEGYLRTATERRSLLELARAIGYELRPGVAASASLAFTLDERPPSPAGVPVEPRPTLIPVGTRAQTIPGQDEKPQTFEVTRELSARPEWNRLRPQLTRPAIPRRGDPQLVLAGTNTQLKTGDAVLVVGPGRLAHPSATDWDVRFVKAVATEFDSDPQRAFTRITLDRALTGVATAGPAPQVFALRQRAALFGHNAPSTALLAASTLAALRITGGAEWPGFHLLSLSGSRLVQRLYLDAAYPRVVPGGWLLLRDGDQAYLGTLTATSEESLSRFGLSAKVTRVDLGSPVPASFYSRIRQTTVFLESEPLATGDAPRPDPVGGATIQLDGKPPAPEPGRIVLVSGTRLDGRPGVEAVEVLSATPGAAGPVTLTLRTALAASYRRDTVLLFANVAPATHGETKTEILGAGDASRRFQHFQLRQKPLTFVQVPTGDGAASTLVVRVNDVAWQEVPSLHGLGSGERCFTTRRADDGTVTVRFGDGLTGARLPTGQENIQATFRVGLGLAGQARAGQISLLLDRPLGVKEVVNPLPALGAGDPETRDQARQNAPRAVLTLGRVVSLRDFEDFARGFAGVGKAQASWIWAGQRRLVAITVLGERGAPLDPEGTLKSLRAALDAAREPHLPILVLTGVRSLFRVSARLLVRPEYQRPLVLADATAALVDAFGFARREFGQAVEASAVIATVQAVPGVEAVDLDSLATSTTSLSPPGRLPARAARYDSAAARPRAAELLEIDPLGIEWKDLPR